MNIQHDESQRRFVLVVDDKLCYIQYRLVNGGIEILHTEVDRSLEGNGYGAELARHALEWARTHHMRVLPTCPFFKVFVMRHPEYADLIM